MSIKAQIFPRVPTVNRRSMRKKKTLNYSFILQSIGANQPKQKRIEFSREDEKESPAEEPDDDVESSKISDSTFGRAEIAEIEGS